MEITVKRYCNAEMFQEHTIGALFFCKYDTKYTNLFMLP